MAIRRRHPVGRHDTTVPRLFGPARCGATMAPARPRRGPGPGPGTGPGLELRRQPSKECRPAALLTTKQADRYGHQRQSRRLGNRHAGRHSRSTTARCDANTGRSRTAKKEPIHGRWTLYSFLASEREQASGGLGTRRDGVEELGPLTWWMGLPDAISCVPVR